MTKMEQIRFIDCKVTKKNVTLYLADKKNNVCVWEVPTPKPIRGHISKHMNILRRSVYDVAFTYTDRDEVNVLINIMYYFMREGRSLWVWVREGFIERINEKYN